MGTLIDNAVSLPTRHVGGAIDPTLFLVHGTGSRTTKYNCAKYCQKNKRKVAYHYIIELDGTLVRLAPHNRRVNHAGRSSWKGREWCNGFSVAVGLVNPGPLGPLKRAYFKEAFEGAVKMASPYHPNKFWLPFTEAQKKTLDTLYAEVCADLGKTLEVGGHYQASPGRKSDPNPTLDLTKLGAPRLDLVPAVKKPLPTKTVLGKQSKEYKAQNGLKVVNGATGAGGIAVVVADAFSLDKMQATKGYFDMLNSFVAAYGIYVLIGGCIGAYLLVEAIQMWKRRSYEDGFYEPSGAQEAEEPS